MRSISIREVKSQKDIQSFIELPWSVYKSDSNWVPPLRLAVKEMLNPKHPFYKTSEGKFFLAEKDGEIVGRIGGFYNRSHNEFHGENIGFWGFFESVKDQEVVSKLFLAVEDFLKKFKIKELRGPVQLSTNYECGLLIEGFDDDPQIMMTHNPKFYQELLENNGHEKAKDLLAYNYDLDTNLPEKVVRVSDRLTQRNNVKYRKINIKKWDQEVNSMYEIYNDAWEKNWGFIPMSKEEFKHSAKDLKSVVNENLVLFCEVDEKPVGFIVGLPDFNQVLKKVPNGKLLPFGIFKILLNKNKSNRVRVITLGLKKEFQVKGLSSGLYTEMYRNLKNQPQYKTAEFSWILEDNYLMNRPLILLGGEVYKKYRIFKKSL